MSFLKVSNLSKKYANQSESAVTDISFECNEGEFIAIVGENGSGKSSLLKLINGLIEPDEGSVFLEGKKVKGPSENLVPGHPDIKLLFQEFNLFPKHTVKENIIYQLRYFSKAAQEERLNELIKVCKLEGLENKLPSELSGGQQQRVALARAMSDRPKLLLMDEPFSNLDVMLKDQIKIQVLDHLRSEGQTMIFITHDLQDALSLADKIMIMRAGQIVQLDIPEKIYEKPVDEYSAYLFGKVNIFDAEEFLQTTGISGCKPTKSKISIRPEHFSITREDKGDFKAIVERIYYRGDSYEIVATVKNKITIRINTRKKDILQGNEIAIKLSKSKIHFVD
ncbi:MAG: ABC transporter ATP-binding protein [Sporocytophaga sp.]|uniref:ABC transporter ATP-binding protein n=1 Tax=Sporocytophaga sp. TaxID=2231183 RepID=UPI001B0DA0F5|nr:ABC transporter ATP-binding protein [Sporocytophaga sp.]MBO9701176.1 ABC transporter ATP-binding protein [Sporocytophaga sp.]